MIGVLIAILLAALVYYLCIALGLPAIIGIVAAILVLISGIGTGYGGRIGTGGFGRRGVGGGGFGRRGIGRRGI